MIYLELFFAFLKIGLFSFGGAYGAIPLIRDVVAAHGWISEEKLTYMIAISESTPGPIMVNLATYIGNTRGGLIGSLAATLGVVMPSFFIILSITAIMKNFIKNRYVQAILQGLKPCVVGIILAVGLQIIASNIIITGEKISFDYRTLAIMIILVLIMVAYKRIAKRKLSPIMLIVISAILGITVCVIV